MQAAELSFPSKEPSELGIAHEVDVDPFTGSAVVRVPLPLTPGRAGATPTLALQYNSSAGSSVFGAGWSLAGLPNIGLTPKQHPNYDGDDAIVFNGSDELIPTLVRDGDDWEPRIVNTPEYQIQCFRSKQGFARVRFEKWTHIESRRIHWRSRDENNLVSIYGRDESDHSRIADPEDPNRVFQWLLEAQYDSLGNAIRYQYEPEDRTGLDASQPFEHGRLRQGRAHEAQRYLKHVLYANSRPMSPDAPDPADNQWHLEVVLDYGDHEEDPLPSAEADLPWPARPDPYSSYRPGFEVRTYRLCRRVLMFHRFPHVFSEAATLVWLMRLDHGLDPDPSGSALRALHFMGYRHDPDTDELTERSLIPLRFGYTEPRVGDGFRPAPQRTKENAPAGLGDIRYRWVDLYGEGLPGLLRETNQAWYYKPNLGGGELGPQQRIAEKPSQRVGSYALTDFDRDGNLNLAVLEGRQAGYCEYDRDAGEWHSFKPFSSAPHLDTAGTRAQWLDLSGDGLPDILISEQNRFVWYPSEGKDGFGAPVELAKPHSCAQPQTITEDLDLELFFADMTGDGMLDQVRIQNGRVEYWPALGRGRFGDAVQMAGAPVFDLESEFQPARLRLVDLDGSGTSDLLYIGRGEILCWKNACGNSFVDGGRIPDLPYIDNVSTAAVLDFLGNGTPCLVWSTPLVNHAEEPIHYLELTDGVTPRLMLSVDNGMGRVVSFRYASSSRDYLRDKGSGRGWVTKLPSHVTLVERKEVIDQIGGARLVTRYQYHDGYYDGEKREFRGFGLVDQYDTESLPVEPGSDDLHTAPSCVRTWLHNGSCRLDVCTGGDCYEGDPEHRRLAAPFFEAPVPVGVQEIADGFRTLAGQVIRQEVYAVERDGRLTEHPFQVTQNGYRLRLLQPAMDGRDACVTFYPAETLTHNYEQSADDPRISHQIITQTDTYGTPTESLMVGYPRRGSSPYVQPAQQRTVLSATRLRLLNLDDADRFELGLPIETRQFELTLPPPADGELYAPEAIGLLLADALDAALDFHALLDPDAQVARARLVGWEQTFYWNDAATATLPLGEAGAPALMHHSESACFDEPSVSTVFADRVSPEMLDSGGYLLRDGYWWQPGAVLHYADRNAFFNLVRSVRPDGGERQLIYDEANLTLAEVLDPRGNRTRADIDFHLLAPHRITDPNGSVSEVRYDPLGVIVVATSYGMVIDDSGASRPYGNAPLTEHVTASEPDLYDVIADPGRYLQDAGQCLFYELNSWTDTGQPLRSVSLVRERFTRDLLENAPPGNIQAVLTFTDGFGRTLQSRQRVEPGPAIYRDAEGAIALDGSGRPDLRNDTDPRWRVSGHTVYNQKQQPVLQYEPYFSPTPEFESDSLLRSFGFATELRYDALGRQVLQLLPNGTFSRTEFGPWEVGQYDPNDTIDEADAYRVLLELRPEEDPERIALADTQRHADTPTVTCLDPQGREIASIETDNDGPRRETRNEVDSQGRLIRIIDPRGLAAFEYEPDMQGRTLHERGIDNGDTWSLPDSLDRLFHQWDGRGIHQHISHDELDRPTWVQVDGMLDEERSLDHRVERLVYGDDPDYVGPPHQNARGRLVEHYDQAGLLIVRRYDINGNPLETERRLLRLPEQPPFDVEPDWRELGQDALDPEHSHITRTAYDALGRVLQQRLPDQTTRSFRYLPSGGLFRAGVTTEDGELEDAAFLQEADYNARGQRTSALLGNGTIVEHTYDERTFRLQRLTAVRPPAEPSDVSRTYQNIEYTYDPVGNITHTVDRAQQPGGVLQDVIQGLCAPSHCDYTYDAFYQLSTATGRVHQALEQHDYRPRSRAAEPKIKGTQHLRLDNGAAVERYSRSYEYDLGGNLGAIQHHSFTCDGDTSRDWTQAIWVSETSNRSVPSTDPNGIAITDPESRFDDNGNCIGMPHLRRMDWNYRNNLSCALMIERTESEGPHDAEYYVYGANGMRIRKIGVRVVSWRPDGTPDQVEIAEKLYLDGCEIKRVHRNGDLWLERFSSHIIDGSERVAIIHQWTSDRNENETEVLGEKRIHYQLSNHLGSTALELAPDGRVISYEEYFPFSGTAFIAGDSVRKVRIKDYRYSGKERDDNTGFYYYGYRYYAPWIGNWLSPDPIGPEDTLNGYQFVSNNPIVFSDYLGLYGDEESWWDRGLSLLGLEAPPEPLSIASVPEPTESTPLANSEVLESVSDVESPLDASWDNPLLQEALGRLPQEIQEGLSIGALAVTDSNITPEGEVSITIEEHETVMLDPETGAPVQGEDAVETGAIQSAIQSQPSQEVENAAEPSEEEAASTHEENVEAEISQPQTSGEDPPAITDPQSPNVSWKTTPVRDIELPPPSMTLGSARTIELRSEHHQLRQERFRQEEAAVENLRFPRSVYNIGWQPPIPGLSNPGGAAIAGVIQMVESARVCHAGYTSGCAELAGQIGMLATSRIARTGPREMPQPGRGSGQLRVVSRQRVTEGPAAGNYRVRIRRPIRGSTSNATPNTSTPWPSELRNPHRTIWDIRAERIRTRPSCPVNYWIALARRLRIPNLTRRGTLTNLRPQDPAVRQNVVRTLSQDSSGRYWIQSQRGNPITPEGRYDFVTLPRSGRIIVTRPNTNPDLSTHLGLSRGGEVRYAGSITFTRRHGANRGAIIRWTNNSGHYIPPEQLAPRANLPMNKFRPR